MGYIAWLDDSGASVASNFASNDNVGYWASEQLDLCRWWARTEQVIRLPSCKCSVSPTVPSCPDAPGTGRRLR